jgi:GH25 family lysozyme M1 (1,4-beta-N-acetylmuramidase)
VTAFDPRPAPPSPSPAAVAPIRPARRLLALVATLVLALVAIDASAPAPTLAATAYAARCDGVAIRSRPSTAGTKLATISKGTRIVAVSRVTGGSWRTRCAGVTARGSSWYRITVVNGKTAASRFGRTYVYAATSLFRKLYTMTELGTACDGVSLRTAAKTTATRKATLPKGTKVISIGSVSGGSWSATCAGKAVSGTTWYKINSVGGKSVSSLYGVSYVYAAKGLFAPWGTVSTEPERTPTPTPTPTPAPDASPTPTPTSAYIEGIDVSHWQGTIDWAKVKAAGKKFAFLKASEHTSFVDDKYATNRANAKAQGILVGAYHFARPDTSVNDAINEADHFIDTAKPVAGELLPVLDLEVSGGLTDAQVAAWAKAFLDRVYERTGVKGAIYMSPSFWTNYAGNSPNLVNAGYKVLWIAHWTTGPAPTVPASNWGGNGWTFWQYTSDGSVSGISGRVDLNRYRHSTFTPVLIP